MNECKHAYDIIVFDVFSKKCIKHFHSGVYFILFHQRYDKMFRVYHFIIIVTSPRSFALLFHRLLINSASNSFMIIYLCYVFSIYIQTPCESRSITRWNTKWMKPMKNNEENKYRRERFQPIMFIDADGLIW